MSFQEFIKQADKYYTVLGVIVLIFIVMVAYMIWLDLKMSKIEKKNEDTIV